MYCDYPPGWSQTLHPDLKSWMAFWPETAEAVAAMQKSGGAPVN
jgi:hypothetical protein